MSKIMDWLENKFAPAMSKITQNPWVSALSGSMMKILPIIMTGSLIFFYNVFRSWIPALPDLSGVLQFTFQLTSLILTFLVANQLMEKLGHTRYVLNAGLTSIIVFLIAIKPTIGDDGIFSVEFGRFGPTGMFVALVVGILVSVVYHFYAKLHILEDSVTIPDFVCEWINQILPMFLCVLLGTIISSNLNIDIYQVISAVFSPLEHLGRTLPGLIIMMMAISFLYSMGISTWFLGTFTTPILMAGTGSQPCTGGCRPDPHQHRLLRDHLPAEPDDPGRPGLHPDPERAYAALQVQAAQVAGKSVHWSVHLQHQRAGGLWRPHCVQPHSDAAYVDQHTGQCCDHLVRYVLGLAGCACCFCDHRPDPGAHWLHYCDR